MGIGLGVGSPGAAELKCLFWWNLPLCKVSTQIKSGLVRKSHRAKN